ncbi:hypothetical protein C0Q70_02356 [Pomacea canaliculata]|uniref:Uncharacterized protein n=1 Tax=Pomacea canaliculata TaxID=400727 RepID=A0A2T7PPN7_POMCA|nr:hypothetical protein C0Q70_02356 [Pomacea canaliculata]
MSPLELMIFLESSPDKNKEKEKVELRHGRGHLRGCNFRCKKIAEEVPRPVTREVTSPTVDWVAFVVGGQTRPSSSPSRFQGAQPAFTGLTDCAVSSPSS